MCDRSTSPKYLRRKSPAYPANKCCGKTRKGNDGRQYISKPDKNGVCRWQLKSRKKSPRKLKSQKKSSPKKEGLLTKMGLKFGGPRSRTKIYYTHDNGGKPFMVDINTAPTGKSIVKIYEEKYTDNDEVTYPKLIKTFENVKLVTIGKSPLNEMTKYSGGHGKRFDGNSILLLLKNNSYVFIGDRIFEFDPSEPISKYYSSVGPNDVPYPVALSHNYVYFMLAPPRHYKAKPKNEIHRIDISEFPKGTDFSDAYGWYYDNYEKSKTLKKVRIKVIKKRIY